MGSKHEFTANLRINTIIEDAQRELKTFGDTLQKTWQNGAPPKELSRKYKGLETYLQSLRSLQTKLDSEGRGATSSELSWATSDYKGFQKILHALTVEFGLFSDEQKKAMLSQDEQKAMKARTDAVNAYTEALRKNEETLRKRAPLEAEKVEAENKKRQLQANQVGLQQQRANLQKAVTAGPSGAGIQYKQNLDTRSRLETAIQKEKDKTLMSPAAIKRSQEQIATLEKQIKELDLTTGKEDYEFWERYRENLKAVETQLTTTEAELKTTNAQIRNIDKTLEGFGVSTTAEEFKKLQQALKDAGVEGADAATDINQLRQMIDKLDKQTLKKVDDNIAAMNKQLVKMSETAREAKSGIDEANDSIERQDEALQNKEAFENKIKQFLGLSGAAIVMRNALQDAMQTIKELDATMTEMAVVTNLGVGDYWDQLPGYTARANELGLAINDVYKADTLFYQQGLKTNEVVALSTQTMKMARVAGLDTAEATNRMTAALRGFNMELSETNAQNVADVYSKLAAITASDVDEISSAMTKTASIASSAGMEFETTAAFLSQIIETTRESAETAGTALKTVIARFQELKKDPAEIGEVDGEIVDANKIETALRSVGVALRDSSGQFRELDDVFLELASKWDGLDKNTQRYIATIAAGSRQQSRFIAMMSDYARTQELVSAANNAAGASTKQFEKTMESLDAKINKLKNAWDEFTMSIMNSDLVKFGVDMLTKFLQVVNKATSGLNGIAGSLTKIISVVAVFKLASQLFKKVETPLFNLYNKIVGESYNYGYKATSEFKRGAEDAATGKEAESKTAEASKDKQQKKSFKEKVGIKDLEEGGLIRSKEDRAERKQAKQTIKKMQKDELTLEEKKAKRDELKEKGWRKDGKTPRTSRKKGDNGKAENENLEETRKEYEKLNQEIEEYENAEAVMAKKSEISWGKVGQGMQAAGAAISGLGIGMSMFGGILSELGLEEAGELFTKFGGAITLVGGAISFIGSIVPAVASVLSAAGISIQTAWWPLLVIGLALITIIGVVMAMLSAIDKAKQKSPEGILQAAEEAAGKASEAADEAAKAFEELSNALDSLSEQYDALEGLTRGTKEWNDAVREVNASVLDLIQNYPELAGFVENEGGVLTIDVESQDVQDVLAHAEAETILTANEAAMANAAVAQASATRSMMDNKAIERIGNIRTNEAIGKDIANVYGSMLFGALGIPTMLGSYAQMVYHAATAKDATKSDETLQQAIAATAEKVSSGEMSGSYEELYASFVGYGVAADEAAILADQFAHNTEELYQFGEALNAVEAQQKAVYDSIAASAQSLADTASFTTDQLAQSAVMVDGSVSETFYKQKMNELATVDFTDKEQGGKYKAEIEAALRDKYGASARLTEDGKVIYNDGTEDKEVTLTNEEMKTMLATRYATEQSAEAIEASKVAIENLSKSLGSKEVAEALYASSDGKSLTAADVEVLENKIGLTDDFSASEWFGKTDKQKQQFYDDNEALQQMWDDLGEEGQKAYAGEFNNFADQIMDGLAHAKIDFDKAGEVVESYMTAGQARTYSEKMQQIELKAGGAEAKENAKAALQTLFSTMEDIAPEQQQRIQDIIDATDWTNLESLMGLSIALQEQFGFSKEAADAYVDALGKASFATSNLGLTVQKYGDLWKSTEKVAQSVKRVTQLQWEYDQALIKGGTNLQQITDQLAQEYQLQATEYKNSWNAAYNNLSTVYAQGQSQYNIDLTKAAVLGENGIDVDESIIAEYIASGQISQEEVDEWIDSLNEQYDNMEKASEGLRNTADALAKQQQKAKDSYYELRGMVQETIVGQIQKQIDIEQATLDATQEANDKLLSKMQEQIDDQRQARQQEEARQNIADLEAQRAFLMASGGSATDIAALDKQIADSKQDYQDSLVDQALANIQDANEKAAEQRQEQITLASQQLELYQNSAQFQRDTDMHLQELLEAEGQWQSTGFGRAMTDYYTVAMSKEQKEDWATEIGGKVAEASYFGDEEKAALLEAALNATKTELSNIRQFFTSIDEEGNVTSTFAGMLAGEATKKSIAGAQNKMDSVGFSTSAVNSVNTTDEARQFERFLSREGSNTTLETKAGQAKNLNGKDPVLSRTEYYANLEKEMLQDPKFNIGDAKTYEQYLDDYIAGNTVEEVDNSAIMIQKDGGAASVSGHNGDFWVAGNYDQNITVEANGVTVSGLEFWTPAKKWADNRNAASLQDTYAILEGKGRTKLNNLYDGSPPEMALAAYKDNVYLFYYGQWRRLYHDSNDAGVTRKDFQFTPYKTGGLADFTGPAWLDGTKAHPELVLNQKDTQNFLMLKDVLAEAFKRGSFTSETNGGSTGNNYYEIEINVDKLDSDYDVEQLADKIRSMIYQDATYRNVNVLNQKM